MRYQIVLMICAIGIFSVSDSAVLAQSATKKQRDFQFTYGATISDLPDGAKVKVWVPIPDSDKHQTAELIQFEGDGQLEQHADEKRAVNI